MIDRRFRLAREGVGEADVAEHVPDFVAELASHERVERGRAPPERTRVLREPSGCFLVLERDPSGFLARALGAERTLRERSLVTSVSNVSIRRRLQLRGWVLRICG